MRALSIRSGHALVRRLILISFLLLPWPVLAEDGGHAPPLQDRALFQRRGVFST